MNRKLLVSSLWLALRAAVAGVLAVVAAQALGLRYPVYALIAAVIVTDRIPSNTHVLGLRRIIGTLLGAAFGAAISQLLGGDAWTIGLAILLVFPACTLMRLDDAAVVAAYIAGIVVLEHSESPWVYAAFRLAETTLGIALAVVISHLFAKVESSTHQRFYNE